MRQLHGFKYHDLIKAALQFYGPLTINQLQEKIAMRLDGFHAPLDVLKADTLTLVKQKQVRKGIPDGIFKI